MVKASGEVNGSNNILSPQRQRSSVSSADGTKKRSLMLLDSELLDCPICYEPLRIPIFQCDNGHLACSLCCPKLSNKCPICALPIGDKRCRAMENVLESVFIPCPNAELGCTKNVSYGKESTHKKECPFSLCSCPVHDCHFAGSYKNLYDHYRFTHLKSYYQQMDDTIICGMPVDVEMKIGDKITVQREIGKKLLFAVQCFKEPCGVYVSVSCIAPSAPEVGEFSYHLSYTVDGHTMTYESSEVKRILQVSFENPEENSMFIPHSLLRGDVLDMELCIKSRRSSTTK